MKACENMGANQNGASKIRVTKFDKMIKLGNSFFNKKKNIFIKTAKIICKTKMENMLEKKKKDQNRS